MLPARGPCWQAANGAAAGGYEIGRRTSPPCRAPLPYRNDINSASRAKIEVHTWSGSTPASRTPDHHSPRHCSDYINIKRRIFGAHNLHCPARWEFISQLQPTPSSRATRLSAWRDETCSTIDHSRRMGLGRPGIRLAISPETPRGVFRRIEAPCSPHNIRRAATCAMRRAARTRRLRWPAAFAHTRRAGSDRGIAPRRGRIVPTDAPLRA
jgi:hypothetical protein